MGEKKEERICSPDEGLKLIAPGDDPRPKEEKLKGKNTSPKLGIGGESRE